MKKHLLKISACLFAAWLGFGISPAYSQEYHDNVVIVLDASGSMREKMSGTSISKMAAAKAALKEVLAQVPDSTHIGLLQFSAKNLRDLWLYPLGPRDEQALLHAIEQPQPGNGTPLGKFIKTGADRLLEEREKQYGYGTYRLLLVTDGEASDRKLVTRHTPDVISRGIIMDVIGVDMRKDHTLAKRAHSYRRANDPASLRSAVAAVFAEVAQSGSDSVGDDAFDIIAGIPSEIAAVALQTLSLSGNHPIGSKPLPEINNEPKASQAATGARAPTQPRPPEPPTGPRRVSLVIILIGGFVGLFILKSLFRGGR